MKPLRIWFILPIVIFALAVAWYLRDAKFLRASEPQARRGTNLVNLIKNASGTVMIEGGFYFVAHNLEIPEGLEVRFGPGATVEFAPGVQLTVKGRIEAIGEPAAPVVFKSAGRRGDERWRGIRIEGKGVFTSALSEVRERMARLEPWPDGLQAEVRGVLRGAHRFRDTVISNVGYGDRPEEVKNNFRAAMEVSRAAVLLERTLFEDIDFIGGLMVLDGFASVKRSEFLGAEMHKSLHANRSVAWIDGNRIIHRNEKMPCRDGLWIIDSAAFVVDNVILGKGDDGVDLKNSVAILMRNTISWSGDEGVDADHQSIAYLEDNKVTGQLNGLQVAAGSILYGLKNTVTMSSNAAVMARNRSAAFLAGTALKQNRQRAVKSFVKEKDLRRAWNHEPSLKAFEYFGKPASDTPRAREVIEFKSTSLIEEISVRWQKHVSDIKTIFDGMG